MPVARFRRFAAADIDYVCCYCWLRAAFATLAADFAAIFAALSIIASLTLSLPYFLRRRCYAACRRCRCLPYALLLPMPYAITLMPDAYAMLIFRRFRCHDASIFLLHADAELSSPMFSLPRFLLLPPFFHCRLMLMTLSPSPPDFAAIFASLFHLFRLRSFFRCRYAFFLAIFACDFRFYAASVFAAAT